jgi:hypothetical protein
MARTFADALLDAVRLINASGTTYAVSGSVARSLYGSPVMSKDVDILAEDAARIGDCLHPQFRRAAADAFQDASGFLVEVFEARTPVEREMLQRSQERPLGPERVRVLDPTDWAAVKLRYARQVPQERFKHLADVQAVAELEKYDCGRLRRLAADFGAERELQDAGVCPTS